MLAPAAIGAYVCIAGVVSRARKANVIPRSMQSMGFFHFRYYAEEFWRHRPPHARRSAQLVATAGRGADGDEPVATISIHFWRKKCLGTFPASGGFPHISLDVSRYPRHLLSDQIL